MSVQTASGTCTGAALSSTAGAVSDDVGLRGTHDASTDGGELSELRGARTLVQVDAACAPAACCDTLDAPTEGGELSELRGPCALVQADTACAPAARSSTVTETVLAALHDRAALEGGAMPILPCLPTPISLRCAAAHSCRLTTRSLGSGWVGLRDTSHSWQR